MPPESFLTPEGDIRAYAPGVVYSRSVTVGHADLTESTNNTAQAVNIGAILPTNAVVVAHDVYVTTVFSGGSASAVTVDIGGTDADAIVDGMDIFTGAATGALTGTLGVHPRGKFSAQQLKATFLTDSSHNLAGLTAGAITVNVFFTVVA